MLRSGWGSLQGWTGSAEAQEVGFPEGPGVLETGLVFSPSGAWAIKGGAPQGCWRGEEGDGLRCPSRSEQGCGHALPATSGLASDGVLPRAPAPPQPARGSLARSLSSLCHIFFATWCHLTREMAPHFPAAGLGAFQALGELRALTAPASSAGPQNPGTLPLPHSGAEPPDPGAGVTEGLSRRPCGARHGFLVPGREMGKAALDCRRVTRSISLRSLVCSLGSG